MSLSSPICLKSPPNLSYPICNLQDNMPNDQEGITNIVNEMQRRNNNLGYGLGVALNKAYNSVFSFGPDLIDRISFSFEYYINGASELHYYITKGDIKKIKKIMIQEKGLINAKNSGGITPLMLASKYRDLKTVKFLIKNGAKLEIKDFENNSPLHYAAESGNVDVLKFFLKNSDFIEVENNEGNTPLMVAAKKGQFSTFNKLMPLEKKSSDAKKNRRLLALALEGKNQSIIDLMIKKMVKVEKNPPSEMTCKKNSKALSEEQEIKNRQSEIWECTGREKNKAGGYIYNFKFREEYLDEEKFEVASNKIWPALEPDFEGIKHDQSGGIIKRFKLLSPLNFSFQNGLLSLPDEEALLANWEQLQSKNPKLPDLKIYSMKGVASDIEFIQGYQNHHLVLSTEKEFVHDSFFHLSAVLTDLIELQDEYQSHKDKFLKDLSRILDLFIVIKQKIDVGSSVKLQVRGNTFIWENSFDHLLFSLGVEVDELFSHAIKDNTPGQLRCFLANVQYHLVAKRFGKLNLPFRNFKHLHEETLHYLSLEESASDSES